MAKALYTIGHSNHSLEKFKQLLSAHRIEVVCDVRSSPYSAYNPQFNREPLQEALTRAGTLYVFLGKELGARSDDPRCYDKGKVQYHRLARSALFQQGLMRLHNGMETYRVTLMCAEKDPLMCHRTILVCRQLRSEDLDIHHILEDGALESNGQAEQRLMNVLKIQPTLFVSAEEELIELAYDRQGEKLAYTDDSMDASSSLEHVER